MDELKHRLRRALWPSLDDALEGAVEGAGSQYTLHRSEFVAHADASLDEVISYLKAHGFHYEILAALKLDTNGAPDHGSYVYRRYPFTPYQVHVHVWQRPNGVTIAAHREYSITRPIRHYYGRYYSPSDGVEHVRELLTEHPPDWNYDTTHNTL